MISSSNFARVATRANLIPSVANLESKDDRSSSILLPATFSLLYFSSLRLMSLTLSQLIRYAGNLVDLRGLPLKICRADFTINDNNDDDENDGGVGDPFDDNKELVIVNVEAAEATEAVGDKGGPFLKEAKQK